MYDRVQGSASYGQLMERRYRMAVAVQGIAYFFQEDRLVLLILQMVFGVIIFSVPAAVFRLESPWYLMCEIKKLLQGGDA